MPHNSSNRNAKIKGDRSVQPKKSYRWCCTYLCISFSLFHMCTARNLLKTKCGTFTQIKSTRPWTVVILFFGLSTASINMYYVQSEHNYISKEWYRCINYMFRPLYWPSSGFVLNSSKYPYNICGVRVYCMVTYYSWVQNLTMANIMAETCSWYICTTPY